MTLIVRCASRACMEAAAVPLRAMGDLPLLRGALARAGWGVQRVQVTCEVSMGQGDTHLAPLCPACWRAAQTRWQGRLNV